MESWVPGVRFHCLRVLGVVWRGLRTSPGDSAVPGCGGGGRVPAGALPAPLLPWAVLSLGDDALTGRSSRACPQGDVPSALRAARWEHSPGHGGPGLESSVSPGRPVVARLAGDPQSVSFKKNASLNSFTGQSSAKNGGRLFRFRNEA